MDNLLNFMNFMNPDMIVKYMSIIAILTSLYFFLEIIIISIAFFICWKRETDIKRRNIWIAIILIGKWMGSLTYLTLEVFLKKEDKNIEKIN